MIREGNPLRPPVRNPTGLDKDNRVGSLAGARVTLSGEWNVSIQEAQLLAQTG